MFNLNISSQKNVLDSEKVYDLIIVGSGPAGLSASIYAARKGLTVGVIGEKMGGQVNDTSSVENFIGFDYITGQGLASNFEKHAKSLEVDFLEDARVKTVKKDKVFSLSADNYMTYQARTVLIASGSKSRKLQVPGEDQFYGRGVTYCAICDGPLFKGKTVTVVGGGNSAVEAAIDLSKIAGHVHLVHRSNFKADKILVDKLKSISNLEIMLKSQIEGIHGEDNVQRVEIKGDHKGTIQTDGVLVEIGYLPNTQFLQKEILNERQEVVIDKNHMTAVEGLFAAGDVTTEKHKQIIVAASEGAKAALSINDYINNL
jgi:alkyl hydroperoxide reductase subunit F